jgi:MoaA/NifB/PqqE/SkfB family radical SAM enzyme
MLNALSTELAYRRRLPVVKSMPYILFLEPLYYCNLECPLCDREAFPSARKNDAGKLSLDLYDRILDELGPYLFQCQIFGLGEPLMNWKLTREIIARTHARHIFTMISTNATLITPEVAKGIAESDLDHLVCAIDGVTQEVYERYRVGGKVADAIQGLSYVVEARARLKRSKLTIEWQYLTHSRNIQEVEAARKIAGQLGVDFRVAPLRGMEHDTALEDEWLIPSESKERKTDYANDFPCYFLWRSLVLNSNGKTARCLVYQNTSQYANLHKMSVREAYNHPSVEAARRLFGSKEMVGNAPDICAGCSSFARHHGKPPGTHKVEVVTESIEVEQWRRADFPALL